MAYATVADVQSRMSRQLSEAEQSVCATLLDDAAVVIEAAIGRRQLPGSTLRLVSCRMVIRAMGSGEDTIVPVGATQGSMSGLGYSQSWTMGASGGASGELYLGKADRALLGIGNRIGSGGPLNDPERGRCLE